MLSLRRFLLLFLRAELRGVEQFVLFFPLHPTVLEPDFDLPLRQAKGVSDLNPSAPGQVAVEVKFLLQLQGLVAGVGLAASATAGPKRRTCETRGGGRKK